MGQKGLSFEEKRTRALEYFYETRDFFQLKDLEKALPKSKGITSMTVKEVIQSLVDDRLVCAEKIGTCNYFWAFPSAALHSRTAVRERLQGELAGLKQKSFTLTEQIEQERASRPESAERREAMEKHASLRKALQKIYEELAEYKENDPVAFQARIRQVQEMRTGINTWTDNLFSLEDWCVKNMGVDRSAFKDMFGLSENIDYV